MSGDGWFKDQFYKQAQEAAEKLGRFNVAIFGKTGVGKSTLINAIFGSEVAATGIGKPVTREEHLYLHEDGLLGVLDTKGLEVGVDTNQIVKELGEYVRRMRTKPLKEQIHIAWYCVRASDRRFEDTEADLIVKLHDLKLSVVLVLTQVPMVDGRYHPDALELAAEIESRHLPLVGERVFLTMAKPDEFAGYPQHGLVEVLDATFRAAPEGAAKALVAAQKVDLKRKRELAETAIKTAVAAATTAGASPIPFSDAAVLVPIQIGMMAYITTVYGVEIHRGAAASVAATAAATTTGKSLAANLLKFVPGVGTIGGGAINATVAGGFTLAMGRAWIAVCEQLVQGRLGAAGQAMDARADTGAIRAYFLDELKRQLKRVKLRRSGPAA